MRCFICGSGCKPLTTNLTKDEGAKDEPILDRERTEDRALRGARGGGIQFRRDEFMELADAAAVRVDCDRLLASLGATGSEPNSLRGMAWPTGLRYALPTQHGRASAAHDALRKRRVPGRHAMTLRHLRTA